jgi:hypothetical protein
MYGKIEAQLEKIFSHSTKIIRPTDLPSLAVQDIKNLLPKFALSIQN